jgi:hypothetical protein
MKHGEFEQKEAKVTKGNQEWDFSGSGSVEAPASPTGAPRPERMKHGEFGQKEAKVTKGNQEWDFSGSGSVVGPGRLN